MAVPKNKTSITQHDGYKWLASDIIVPVIEDINRGQNVAYNLGILMSKRNRKWMQVLGWDPDAVIERVLASNGIEIVKRGNGHE